jgi:membrane-associated protease RseP (regulator of RpoE activity)
VCAGRLGRRRSDRAALDRDLRLDAPLCLREQRLEPQLRRATDQRRVPNLAPAQDTAGAWKAAQPLTAPKGTSVDAAGPRLGVQALPITEDARRQFGLSVSKGALVSGVTVGSPAERVGIPLGAAITAFDGQPVNSPQELADLIRRAGAGREVDVTLNIRGQETHRRVMLASAAAPQASAAAPKETPRLNFQPRAEGATLPASPTAAPTRSDDTRMGELEAQIRRLEARIKSLEEALERNAKP